MSELKTIYADTQTEDYDYYPAYINYSQRDGGKMVLTVRGTNQQQCQEIELPLSKFWDMVAAVGSFNLPADIEFVPSIIVDTLSDKCKQIESELSASQAREAALLEKLEAALTANIILGEELQATEAALKLSAAKYNQDAGVTEFVAVKAKELAEHWKQRAEAAEARIKASQEPETWLEAEKARTKIWLACEAAARSVLLVASYMGAKTSCGWKTEVREFSAAIWEKLRPLHAIPPELAELQRENSSLSSLYQQEVAKRAEAQHRCGIYAEQLEELRKLLESKVPDDSAIISNELVRFLNGSDCIDGLWFGEEHPQYRGRFWWRKLLPQPKEPKQ